MIYIIGNQGNMGKRYTAILNYLGENVKGHDLDAYIGEELAAASGFIVATPTKNHLNDVVDLFKYEKPILCEKPLTKNIEELNQLEDKYREELSLLSVVNQYQYLKKGTNGKTVYNYYKSGNDGLAWDCLNIIGLAKGDFEIDNKMPYWRCVLNGAQLNLGMMDHAYVDMIKNWLKDPKSNYAYARKAHEKVALYLAENSF